CRGHASLRPRPVAAPAWRNDLMDAISDLNSAPVRQRAAQHRTAVATLRPDLSMWHYALLALLPLLLLAVNRSWLASSLFLDPYISLGYYLDLLSHLQ